MNNKNKMASEMSESEILLWQQEILKQHIQSKKRALIDKNDIDWEYVLGIKDENKEN